VKNSESMAHTHWCLECHIVLHVVLIQTTS